MKTMTTNVPIVSTEEQLENLGFFIDSEGGAWPNKRRRRATRKDIIALCQQHINGLANAQLSADDRSRTRIMVDRAEAKVRDMYKPDPEDVPLMARPDDPGYVYGWNKVKRGAA